MWKVIGLWFLVACGDNTSPEPTPDALPPTCPELGCNVPTCSDDVCTCNGQQCTPTGIPPLPACAAVGCLDAPSGSPDVWTPCEGELCFCRVGETAVVGCSR